MSKVTFGTIFQRHDDGSIEPRQRVRIGGVTLGPGVRFSKGVAFAGIDLFQFLDRDLEIQVDQNGVFVITGIY